LACLALFAALGGSTYAATSIGSSSLHFTNAKLKNGWHRYGPAQAPAGYVKDSLGVVHLRGVINGGSGTAFFLPSALRPSHEIELNVWGANGAVVFVSIHPDGRVIPLNWSSATSFDAVSFAAGE
jgi:hypothetical protein